MPSPINPISDDVAAPNQHVLATAVDARIEQFARPRSIATTTADRCLPALKELTRRAGPRSAEDAKNLLTAGCRLLAHADNAPARDTPVDVHSAITDVTVADWSHQAQRDGMEPGSLANYVRWMNRLVRARNGLAPRERVPTQPRTTTTLELPVLLTLARSIAEVDQGAALALVAAAGAGAVASSHRVRVHERGTHIVSGSNLMAVTQPWRALAASFLGSEAGEGEWQRMRDYGASAGLTLTGPHLRRRWATDAVAEAATPATALTVVGSRRLLADAAEGLPSTSDASVKEALRG